MGNYLREFDRLVVETTKRMKGEDNRSPAMLWRDAILRAEGLKMGSKVWTVTKRAPLLPKARSSKAKTPLWLRLSWFRIWKHLRSRFWMPVTSTLKSAFRGDADKTKRLERHVSRMEHVLGPLKDMPLVPLKREHGREVRDYLLNTYRKKDGNKLSVDRVSRELSIMSAMVSLGRRIWKRGVIGASFAGVRLGW